MYKVAETAFMKGFFVIYKILYTLETFKRGLTAIQLEASCS